MKPPGIQTKPFKLHRGFQSHNSIDSQKDAQDEWKNGSRGQRFKKENNPEYDGEKSQQAVQPVLTEETFKPGDFNQLCDAVDDKADAGADAGRRQGGAGQ